MLRAMVDSSESLGEALMDHDRGAGQGVGAMTGIVAPREWAIDRTWNWWIVQARPITTTGGQEGDGFDDSEDELGFAIDEISLEPSAHGEGRVRLLEHEPLRAHVIACVPPIAA